MEPCRKCAVNLGPWDLISWIIISTLQIQRLTIPMCSSYFRKLLCIWMESGKWQTFYIGVCVSCCLGFKLIITEPKILQPHASTYTVPLSNKTFSPDLYGGRENGMIIKIKALTTDMHIIKIQIPISHKHRKTVKLHYVRLIFHNLWNVWLANPAIGLRSQLLW